MRRILATLLIVLWAAIASAQTGSVTYTPVDDLFPNPERGLYHGSEVSAEGTPLSLSALQAYRTENVTLIARVYYLDPFVNSDLSTAELNLVQTDLNTMRKAGIKCILRFAYTHYMNDTTHPDAPLNIILRHLDQLNGVIDSNEDVIAVMQAGFIGAWGEWHSSTHGLDTSAVARQTVLSKILQVLPKDRMVQLRYVRHKWAIYGRTPLTEAQAFSQADASRVGFHNDAFLRNWDDSGTYNFTGALSDTAVAKPYVSAEGMWVPIGGETNGTSSRTVCDSAMPELARLHWSFLHKEFYPAVMDGFATAGCLDDMDRRLGYRFSLLNASMATGVKPGNGFHVSMRITNWGWTSPYNPRNVEVLLRNTADSTVYSARLPDDPRFWLAGDTVVVDETIGVPVSMPQGSYEVLLNMPDPQPTLYRRPEYAIRLANANVWEAATGYNKLLSTARIDTAAAATPYSGTLVFHLLTANGVTNPPSTPTPASPPNGATSQPTTLTLRWRQAAGADRYQAQVASDSGFAALVLNDSTVLDTTDGVGTLASNMKYFWRVRARNTAGVSPWSSVWNWVTLGQPSAPVLASPQNGAIGQVLSPLLQWHPVQGALKYRLEVYADSSLKSLVLADSTTGDTSKQIGPLGALMSYYWHVRASGTTWVTAYSTASKFSTGSSPTQPGPILASPTNGAVGQPLSPAFKWHPVLGALAYRIEVYADSSLHSLILADSTAGDTSTQAGPLAPLTAYYWHVRASGSSWLSAYSAPFKFTTDSLPVPLGPALLNPPSGMIGEPLNPLLQWHPVQGALSYRVEIYVDSLLKSLALADSTPGDTSKQVGPLNAGLTYYWRVRAGGGSWISAFSSAWSFTTANAAATITVNKVAIDFGKVAIGSTKKDSVLVGNPQTHRVLIDSVRSSARQYTPAPTSLILNAGDDKSVYVSFAPTSRSQFNGSVIMFDSLGNALDTVRVSGKGVNPPRLRGLTTTMTFGPVETSVAATDSFTVYNTGDLDLTIYQILGSAPVTLIAPESATIAPADSQKFYVSVTATANGLDSCYVVLLSNSDSSPDSMKVVVNAVTSVGLRPEQPRAFDLQANYPNPFNPSTSIRYQLPVDSRVTLKIYNVIGNEVETLVDGYQSAGYKTIRWNGVDSRGNIVPSGIYFYRLSAQSGGNGVPFVRTRTMVFIK